MMVTLNSPRSGQIAARDANGNFLSAVPIKAEPWVPEEAAIKQLVKAFAAARKNNLSAETIGG